MFRVSEKADFPWSRYHTRNVPDCAACPLCLFSHALGHCFRFRHSHTDMIASLPTCGSNATSHSLSQMVGTPALNFCFSWSSSYFYNKNLHFSHHNKSNVGSTWSPKLKYQGSNKVLPGQVIAQGWVKNGYEQWWNCDHQGETVETRRRVHHNLTLNHTTLNPRLRGEKPAYNIQIFFLLVFFREINNLISGYTRKFKQSRKLCYFRPRYKALESKCQGVFLLLLVCTFAHLSQIIGYAMSSL
jgi:hypothetical protein